MRQTTDKIVMVIGCYEPRFDFVRALDDLAPNMSLSTNLLPFIALPCPPMTLDRDKTSASRPGLSAAVKHRIR